MSYQLPTFEPLPRSRWGWALLWTLLGLLIAGSLYGYLSRDRYEAAIIAYAQAKESVVPQEKSRAAIQALLAGLDDDPTVTPRKRPVLRTALRGELGMPALDWDLKKLQGGSPAEQKLARAYGGAPPSPPDARDIARALEAEGPLFRLASRRALERAGLAPRPLIELDSMSRAAISGLVILLLLAAGLAVFVWFSVATWRGLLRPRGFAMGPVDKAAADGLAARAGLILLAFVSIEFVALGLAGILDGVWAMVASFVLLTMIALLVVPRLRLAGIRLSLKELGLGGMPAGRAIAWGAAGAMAVWPIMLLILTFTERLFSGMPPAQSPITVGLGGASDWGTLLGLAFMAVVLAPIWEEIAFRGMLFPALAGAFGSPLAGGVLAALIFGTMHPAGIPVWLPLASVGGVSCLLYYYTRSLLPSIVMHAIHNALQLALMLIASG